MYAEGSCFGWDSIVAGVKINCLTAAPSLVAADGLSRSAYPSGNGGIFWVLATWASPHQPLLLSVLADHFRIGLGSVGF